MQIKMVLSIHNSWHMSDHLLLSDIRFQEGKRDQYGSVEGGRKARQINKDI